MDKLHNHPADKHNITPVIYPGNMFDSQTDGENNFMINTLKHMASDTTLSQQNFWMLTQYALRHIRSLQNDLNAARNEIIEKQQVIEELEKHATTDSLTGLTNRRGFLTAMQQEMDRTNRDLISGGLLIMIDMDNFKTINDTYGHHVGDEALKLVSQTLMAHIRTMDTAARLGGDEFVLIFSNANKTETAARLQKLARKLNSLLLNHDDDVINIRASIGVQTYQKGDSIQTIMHKADMAMYKTKEEKKTRL